ncbi:MAG: hypothetical protein FWH55_14055 [Oscillospiraceae bacterium]|nr:hypothetical protein [Oscillospiraceae bacterium]
MTASPNFPQALSALPQWVCWRLEDDKKSERKAKVPYQPLTGKRASSSNPQHWGTLQDALYGMQKYLFTGIGFVFTQDSGIVGLDVDNCLDENGKPNEVAADIIAHIPPTYTEITPSDRGLHFFLKGMDCRSPLSFRMSMNLWLV